MADERAYWIWLQQAFSPGSPKPVRIVGQYKGGIVEFQEGGARLWNSRRDVTDREAAILQTFTLEQAEARLDYALRMGWKVICCGSPDYPQALRNIPDPPAVLYYKGELPDVDRLLTVGVVGARKTQPGVEETARRFGYELAMGGACVVTGEALGVDSAVLNGALSVPGAAAVCVLPVSLDSGYLAGNAKLRHSVYEHGGALITEYFSQEAPVHGTFPVRNRLITGLSRGVVLIQAAQKSGTILYAGRALEQDRDVFVYPGPENDPAFAGGRALIEDGATAVENGTEVLAEYEGVPVKRIRMKPAPVSLPEDDLPFLMGDMPEEEPYGLDGLGLSPIGEQVLTALSIRPIHVADLAQKTGLSTASLLGTLTELEVEGLVESLPGKRYRRQ